MGNNTHHVHMEIDGVYLEGAVEGKKRASDQSIVETRASPTLPGLTSILQ
jgi:hypothetical protein